MITRFEINNITNINCNITVITFTFSSYAIEHISVLTSTRVRAHSVGTLGHSEVTGVGGHQTLVHIWMWKSGIIRYICTIALYILLALNKLACISVWNIVQ